MAAGGSGRGRDKCGATTRAGGSCGRPAGWGTDHVGAGHCKLHGGSTPGGKKYAQRLLAADAVATYGLPIVTTPEEALVDELHRTAGHVAWLNWRIRRLEESELVWGLTKETGDDVEHRAVPSVWLELYHRERRHYADVAARALAAGIAERQIRLAERYAERFGRAISAILGDLGVLEHPEAPEVVRRHLLELEQGDVEAA